jgi:hypothetical protein
MTQTSTLKLAKRPKGSGGVKYEGTNPDTNEDVNIYVPQEMLRRVSEGGDFPETIVMTLSAK